MYRAEDFFELSAREIGPADTSGKEGIAREQLLLGRKIKTGAAFGVAGRMNDFCGQRTSLHQIGLFQAVVDYDFSGRFYTDPRGLSVEHLQQREIILV